jgi:putrescine transport system substrate-binding protein
MSTNTHLLKGFLKATLFISILPMVGCNQPDSSAHKTASTPKATDNTFVNFYNWNDYLAPDTISNFERKTGIKVRLAYFDTNETLESKVLTGHSGFDVVVPTAPFLQRQIQSGAYQVLDKKRLPNLANLDPGIMAKLALNDPGNAHAIVYAWGTYGLGFNQKMVAAELPAIPVDSWRLVFDRAFASKLAKCGINIVDEPTGVIRVVLNYLGREPNTPSLQDLADAQALLLKIRPFIRNINSSSYIEALANGDICIAVGYNGDVVQARKRAHEANNGITINYVIPKEGALVWFDTLAIPRDAPHLENAHVFLNYLMDPQVIANVTNATGFANANAAATPLVNQSIAADAAVYPTRDEQARLFVQVVDTPEQTRAITRIWQKFKTGQ